MLLSLRASTTRVDPIRFRLAERHLCILGSVLSKTQPITFLIRPIGTYIRQAFSTPCWTPMDNISYC